MNKLTHSISLPLDTPVPAALDDLFVAANSSHSITDAAPLVAPVDDGFLHTTTFATDTASAFDLDQPQFNGTRSTTASVSASRDQRIDGQLSGIRWSGSITYSDPDSPSDYQAGYVSDQNRNGVSAQNEGFSQLNSQQMLAFHFALDQANYGQPSGAGGFSVEGFTNLDISYAGRGSGTSTIRVANSSDPSTSYAFYPSTAVYGGDSFIGTSARNPVAGNYSWFTMLHELGHSLGLAHGHTGGNFGPLPSNVDSMEFSIMTYRSYIGQSTVGGLTNESWGLAQTYMMLDIAALQYMYGADFTSNSGNTVYTWSPTTGASYVDGLLAINPGANRIFQTIWDGGGIDTYDLSNYTTSLTIDLTPGGHSIFSLEQRAYLGGGPNGGYARGNVFNALQYQGDARSLIENAVGGSAADTIIGNIASNSLVGNGGADILIGDAGNDFLNGGAGGDNLYGGVGIDFATYENATTGVVADLADRTRNTGEAAGDYYDSIEGLIGSAHSDILLGDASTNSLFGLGGNDTLVGQGGGDALYGGDGDDSLYGGLGADYFDGGAGTDYVRYDAATTGVIASLLNRASNTGEAAGDIYIGIEGFVGSSHGDTLVGDDASNVIYGEGGDDLLLGQDGSDTLFGGDGSDGLNGGLAGDYLYGGAGFDFARYDAATTGVIASLGDRSINSGEASGDFYFDIEGLVGSSHADILFGDSGSNIILGQGGHDTILGAGGDDALYGGDGDDSLNGGVGGDLLNGGAGYDFALYDGASAGVIASLANPAVNTGEAAGDVYVNIEGLVGSIHGDILLGDDGNNIVYGLSGDDTLLGQGGSDSIFGGDGSDALNGGLGADYLDGGAGFDFARYDAATSGVTVSLLNPAINTGEAAGDIYVSIEGLAGSSFRDILIGNNEGNVIYGLDGNDSLYGAGGADILFGGQGADAFVLIYDVEAGVQDRIGDFEYGQDTIYLAAGLANTISYAFDGVNTTVVGGSWSLFVANSSVAQVQNSLVFA